MGQIGDPAAAYRALNVSALSSDTEQMPFSILEAMATWLPVAATNVGDVAHMLCTDSRTRVAHLSVQAFACKFKEILNNPGLHMDLRVCNRKRVEAYFD